MREAYLSGCDLQVNLATCVGEVPAAHLPWWENVVIVVGAVASFATVIEMLFKYSVRR